MFHTYDKRLFYLPPQFVNAKMVLAKANAAVNPTAISTDSDSDRTEQHPSNNPKK